MERKAVKIQDCKPGFIYSLSSYSTELSFQFTITNTTSSTVQYLDGFFGILNPTFYVYLVREYTSLEKELL
jgi:hypothetical protein